MPTTSSGPLDGLRVVEVGEGVAAPMAARLLADAGADVVKIEGAEGDRSRGWGPASADGVSPVFESLNRNKRSVVFPGPAGPGSWDPLHELLARADVAIVDAGRLDVDSVMSRHDSLTVCVVSAWGPDGPWADRPGGELPAQLASEATTSLGRIGEEPVRLGDDHGGMLAATHAVQGVLAALLARDECGPQRVDVSLFGSLLQMRGTLWVALSNPDDWRGFHVESYVRPPDHGYTAKDRRITFAAAGVADKRALLADLHMDFVFEDDRLELLLSGGMSAVGDHSHTVHDLWDRGLSQWTFDEVVEILERHGGWACEYLDHQEFVEDEHTRHMGLIVDVPSVNGGTMRQVRPPWQFGDTPASIRRRAPGLGEHTAEIGSMFRDGHEQGGPGRRGAC